MAMLTTNEIDEFYAQGLEMGKVFMLVALDTFSYDYYPVFTDSKEDAKAEYERLHGKNMQKVLEVYDLNGDRFWQLNEKRCNALMIA